MLNDAAHHMLSFLEGLDVPVTGTSASYKRLRETFDVLMSSGYFNRPLRSPRHAAVGHDTDQIAAESRDLHATSSPPALGEPRICIFE